MGYNGSAEREKRRDIKTESRKKKMRYLQVEWDFRQAKDWKT